MQAQEVVIAITPKIAKLFGRDKLEFCFTKLHFITEMLYIPFPYK